MATPSNRPIIVVGVFRSGTSLLCSLLNQHPQLAVMFECDVWNFPRSLLKLRFNHNWMERIEFFNQALSRHGIVSPDHRNGVDKIRTPLELYQAFGAIKGASVSGEKSPFYCSRLEWLHRQYPDAAFILVWRDPVEVYRSVVKAGQTSRFFGKPGMLSRMIYQQEQAIRQAERIEKRGARILRVDYARVVDQTERVCRDISAFLGVPFDARMLELNRADLSSIYQAPHHAFLRRGIIERQPYSEDLVPLRIGRKLERYRHRWEKRQAQWLSVPSAGPPRSGPGPVEFVYHNVVGRALTFKDSAVRAAFEFLPLNWLRVYRLLKSWVINPPSGAPDEKTSLLKDCQRHWQTILTAALLLGVVSFVQRHSNPHLGFILFYGIPCALVALVVNLRWASLFVLVSSVVPALIQYGGDNDYRSGLVFGRNLFSRFILLEILVLTLGRIRLEFSETGHEVS